MSVTVPARLIMVLLLCAVAVACGDAPATPEDVAREYLTAYWANDYERLYEVLAPSEIHGETRAEWVEGMRLFETAPARPVAGVILQPVLESLEQRDYKAVLTFGDGATFTDEVTLVRTHAGWRVVR